MRGSPPMVAGPGSIDEESDPPMYAYVLEMLQCPHCHASLAWSIAERQGERITEAEARCTSCQTNYPVREGIGLFLTPDLPRQDLWEDVEGGLTRHLRSNPDIERQLMES